MSFTPLRRRRITEQFVYVVYCVVSEVWDRKTEKSPLARLTYCPLCSFVIFHDREANFERENYCKLKTNRTFDVAHKLMYPREKV